MSKPDCGAAADRLNHGLAPSLPTFSFMLCRCFWSSMGSKKLKKAPARLQPQRRTRPPRCRSPTPEPALWPTTSRVCPCRKPEGGFLAGVCGLGDRPLAFRDPPPPRCRSRTVLRHPFVRRFSPQRRCVNKEDRARLRLLVYEEPALAIPVRRGLDTVFGARMLRPTLFEVLVCGGKLAGRERFTSAGIHYDAHGVSFFEDPPPRHIGQEVGPECRAPALPV